MHMFAALTDASDIEMGIYTRTLNVSGVDGAGPSPAATGRGATAQRAKAASEQAAKAETAKPETAKAETAKAETAAAQPAKPSRAASMAQTHDANAKRATSAGQASTGVTTLAETSAAAEKPGAMKRFITWLGGGSSAPLEGAASLKPLPSATTAVSEREQALADRPAASPHPSNEETAASRVNVQRVVEIEKEAIITRAVAEGLLPAGARFDGAGNAIHTVQKGESYASIAARANGGTGAANMTTIREIQRINNEAFGEDLDSSLLRPGDEIRVPQRSLSDLRERFGSSLQAQVAPAQAAATTSSRATTIVSSATSSTQADEEEDTGAFTSPTYRPQAIPIRQVPEDDPSRDTANLSTEKVLSLAMQRGLIPAGTNFDADGNAVYTVRTGDSYWAIAERANGGTMNAKHFQAIVNMNSEALGRDPRSGLIHPGEQIVIPGRSLGQIEQLLNSL